MKQALKVLGIIVLSLLALFLFHNLNSLYPNNIVSKIFKGLGMVLTPVLVALVILYLVSPLTQKMIDKGKMSKGLAVLLTVVLVVFVFIIILGLISWFLITQGKILYDQITAPEFLIAVKNWFYNNQLGSLYDFLENYIKNFDSNSILGSMGSFVSIAAQGVTSIILVPIFLWHFLKGGNEAIKKVQENIPNNWKKTVVPILDESNEVIALYFKSKIISMLVLFIMFVFVYAFLGLPVQYILFFALIISLLDLIPYLGPTVGLLIPIVYLFSIDGANLFYLQSLHVNAFTATIILFGINVVIQFIQGNIVVPMLAGKEMHINSAVILVFMIFFGYILGLWGIILAIPLGGILIVVWAHLKEHDFYIKHDDDNKNK